MTKEEFMKKWLNDADSSWGATALNTIIECYKVNCDYIDAILEEEKEIYLKIEAEFAD